MSQKPEGLRLKKKTRTKKTRNPQQGNTTAASCRDGSGRNDVNNRRRGTPEKASRNKPCASLLCLVSLLFEQLRSGGSMSSEQITSTRLQQVGHQRAEIYLHPCFKKTREETAEYKSRVSRDRRCFRMCVAHLNVYCPSVRFDWCFLTPVHLHLPDIPSDPPPTPHTRPPSFCCTKKKQHPNAFPSCLLKTNNKPSGRYQWQR